MKNIYLKNCLFFLIALAAIIKTNTLLAQGCYSTDVIVNSITLSNPSPIQKNIRVVPSSSETIQPETKCTVVISTNGVTANDVKLVVSLPKDVAIITIPTGLTATIHSADRGGRWPGYVQFTFNMLNNTRTIEFLFTRYSSTPDIAAAHAFTSCTETNYSNNFKTN